MPDEPKTHPLPILIDDEDADPEDPYYACANCGSMEDWTAVSSGHWLCTADGCGVFHEWPEEVSDER